MIDKARKVEVLRHKPYCLPCGKPDPVYSPEYDVYACPGCKRWLEPKCSDRQCGLCHGRPAAPSDTMFVAEAGGDINNIDDQIEWLEKKASDDRERLTGRPGVGPTTRRK